MNDIPMRRSLTRQVNIKITEHDFQDLELLRASGVDIGELLRPTMLERIRDAKKVVATKLDNAG